MVSPRRSSRARSATHAVNSHSSSHSSASSSRSRHTRHRTDDADAGTSFPRDDEQNDANTDSNSVAEDGMDDGQEDEITRCVCGYQEYQGGDDDAQSDTDGLFIQCDQCSVWQHGYCVGITDADSTPENYYCEKCKPELHKEGHTKAGMKTSIYIPAQPTTERERERERKAAQAKENQKRRTTMNSRDAEYDDEVLKRMIELSKQDSKSGESARSARGRKRGSSDEGSEEPKDSKRPRTSDSPDAQSNTAVESGDDKPSKTPAASSKKSKNKVVAAPVVPTSSKRTSARNRVATEKAEARKEVEAEIQEEHVQKKSNRSTNRTNIVEEPVNPPTVSEPPPDTPQQTTKRPARTNANGSRRRGNNRNARPSEDLHEASPMSRDQSSANHSNRHDPTSVLEKPTKPRLPAARMTLNEMKRRVNGISEYITRTQVEMASSRQSDIYAYLAWMEQKGTPVNRSNATTSKDSSSAPTPPSAGTSTIPSQDIPRIEISDSHPADNGTGAILDKASDLLSSNMNSHSLEIMEALSLKINKWQQNYGEVVL